MTCPLNACNRGLTVGALHRLTTLLVASVIACSSAGCSKSQSGKSQSADACAPDAFDHLLQKYVKAGKVDYAALKSTKADLDSFDDYLKRIATCDASTLPPAANAAFWVNAYNAFNIKGVLDHWPIDNIKSVDGFLDKKRWRVANLDLTINDMEYKQLIPKHKDARDHFAVVCADLGSVPLESRAYTGDDLEAKRDKKAREFVADPNNFRVDVPGKRVYVSMLFSPEWYEKDFTGDPRFQGKKAVEYLIPYVDKPTADFLAAGEYTVSYIDWNWSLNAASVAK
jgi:hypothetical protein